MAKLRLSFACALYDRMQPLYTGEVQPAGIELNFIPIEEPRPIFDRMSADRILTSPNIPAPSSCSASPTKASVRRDPVFPRARSATDSSPSTRSLASRSLRTSRRKRRRAALHMTAAIFIRGLRHEFGVDFEKIHWVQGRGDHAGSRQSNRAAAKACADRDRSFRPLAAT
jgi:4,5-dihydroxyphthalate decarboxylase